MMRFNKHVWVLVAMVILMALLQQALRQTAVQRFESEARLVLSKLRATDREMVLLIEPNGTIVQAKRIRQFESILQEHLATIRALQSPAGLAEVVELLEARCQSSTDVTVVVPLYYEFRGLSETESHPSARGISQKSFGWIEGVPLDDKAKEFFRQAGETTIGHSYACRRIDSRLAELNITADDP